MCEARIQNAKKKCKLQGKMEAHDVQNGFKKFLFGASSKPSFQGIKCNGSNEWNAGEKGIVKGEKTLQGKKCKQMQPSSQNKYGPECEKDINNCQGIENFFLLKNSLKKQNDPKCEKNNNNAFAYLASPAAPPMGDLLWWLKVT